MKLPMTEKGKIREIKGSNIIIKADRSDFCFGCTKMECKTNGGFLNAENLKALPLEIGQTVELKTPDASKLGQTLIAILPPAFGFLLGFSLTRLLFPDIPEEAAASSGVILLFVCAFIVYKIRKKFPVKESPRYVERILA